MSAIKRWLEDHIDELSDETLRGDMGFTTEDIEVLRDCLSNKRTREI